MYVRHGPVHMGYIFSPHPTAAQLSCQLSNNLTRFTNYNPECQHPKFQNQSNKPQYQEPYALTNPNVDLNRLFALQSPSHKYTLLSPFTRIGFWQLKSFIVVKFRSGFPFSLSFYLIDFGSCHASVTLFVCLFVSFFLRVIPAARILFLYFINHPLKLTSHLYK